MPEKQNTMSTNNNYNNCAKVGVSGVTFIRKIHHITVLAFVCTFHNMGDLSINMCSKHQACAVKQRIIFFGKVSFL